MNIYIEGPDATGKTTLAEWLHETYGFEVEHLTAESPNTRAYHDMLMLQDKKVFDRFCLGEIVYSKIYGRVPKMTLDDCVQLLEKAQAQQDIFIVLATSNLEILIKRLIERGELNYLSEIKEQNDEFIKLCYALKAVEYERFFVYDIARGYDDLYNLLRRELEDAKV